MTKIKKESSANAFHPGNRSLPHSLEQTYDESVHHWILADRWVQSVNSTSSKMWGIEFEPMPHRSQICENCIYLGTLGV